MQELSLVDRFNFLFTIRTSDTWTITVWQNTIHTQTNIEIQSLNQLRANIFYIFAEVVYNKTKNVKITKEAVSCKKVSDIKEILLLFHKFIMKYFYSLYK